MGYTRKEKGIYSYYKNSDKDKKHVAYYFNVVENGKSVKKRAESNDIRNVRKERENYAIVKAEAKVVKCLDDVPALYLGAKNNKPMQPKAIGKYNNHIKPLIGTKKIENITEHDVARVLASIEDKGLQPRNIMIVLKSMLKFAGSLVKVQVDSASTKQKHYFNEEGIMKVMKLSKMVDDELYFFCNMLLYTAQRPKNILDLKVSDINLEKNTISFAEIKGQTATTMPISSKLIDLLTEWIKDKSKSDNLISQSYESLKVKAVKVFDEFNRPMYYEEGMSKEEEETARTSYFRSNRDDWASFYSLRHTAGMNIYKNTRDIYAVKNILRHSDIKMSLIYAKMQDDAIEEAINAI